MLNASERLSPQSLPEQVAAWLVKEISEERLAPGQKITEQQIAEQCSVSRGPVRDALRLVEKIGLVTLLPRRGAMVAKLDVEEVSELFEIRAAMTKLLVSWILDRATRQELKKLVDLSQQLNQLLEDPEAFFHTANEVGGAFVELAQSNKLGELLEPVHTQLLRYRHHAFMTLKARKSSARGHQKIAKAMLAGDVESAHKLVDDMAKDLKLAAISALADTTG